MASEEILTPHQVHKQGDALAPYYIEAGEADWRLGELLDGLRHNVDFLVPDGTETAHGELEQAVHRADPARVIHFICRCQPCIGSLLQYEAIPIRINGQLESTLPSFEVCVRALGRYLDVNRDAIDPRHADVLSVLIPSFTSFFLRLQYAPGHANTNLRTRTVRAPKAWDLGDEGQRREWRRHNDWAGDEVVGAMRWAQETGVEEVRMADWLDWKRAWAEEQQRLASASPQDEDEDEDDDEEDEDEMADTSTSGHASTGLAGSASPGQT